MKYILLILLSFNSYAVDDKPKKKEKTPEQLRIKAVRQKLRSIGIKRNDSESQEVIAKLLTACEIEFNSAFFYPELFKVENESALSCFMDGYDDVALNDAKAVIKASEKKAKKKLIESYDCNLETGYVKLLCEMKK